jgi:basic membrane lipoprotein Med (substrate-binding protein (PBP1-ABC) superfamily)
MNFGSRRAVKGTQVFVKLTNDIADATKNQEATSALIAQGADVIVVAVNSVVSPQIASRAQDAGKLYIGSYVDESKYAPNATVLSVITDFLGGYRTVADQVAKNQFKPGQYIKGIEHAWVKATPFRAGVGGLTQARAKQLDVRLRNLAQQLARGKIRNPHCQAE